MAADLGWERLQIDPEAWIVDVAQHPESSVALGAVHKIADGVIAANPLYEGAVVALNGNPEQPQSMSFISQKLSRRTLRDVRGEVVADVNDILAKLQSPHRLQLVAHTL